MRKTKSARIQDLLGLLHTLYPPRYAEEWDNVGLQLGDPQAEVARVLVALDPSPAALRQAEAVDAQALLTHHPLIFRPLRQITAHDEVGAVVLQAARAGIAVISAHTNLDRAAGGLNDWLAEALGLHSPLPLLGTSLSLTKIVVYVPSGYEEQVAEALFAAGAGTIGGYDQCSFRSSGVGTFRPGPGSTPFFGSPGETERAREVRLETIIPTEAVRRAVTRMIKAHPYEEVAYDLLPLANQRTDVGLGRIGRLQTPTTLGELAATTRQTLNSATLRLVGDPATPVAKVAVCGGSGATLIAEAQRQGADVLVTGDLKYHEALSARARGLAVIDAGHFATERLMVPQLCAVLQREAEAKRLLLVFIESESDSDPFTPF